MVAAAAISAVSTVGGALISGRSANSAANTQVQAAQAASGAQLDMFNQTREALGPYMTAGLPATNALLALTGAGTFTGGTANQALTFNPATDPGAAALQSRLIMPFENTAMGGGGGGADQFEALKQTPGYQFTLDQGLKASQAGYAARGLGSSGAAMKGAANYATGLASGTYNQQLANYLSQNQQIYNMLMGQQQLGETAAAGFGGYATQTGASLGSNMIGAGNAQAASQIAGGNALASGLSGAGGNISQYMMMNSLMGNPGSGAAAAGNQANWWAGFDNAV
jgi:hypothetical protein